MSFITPTSFFNKTVKITVIGAGGTGSYLLSYLAQINYLLRMVGGHDCPLQVHVYDPDTVSETNVGRQNFWPMDIGMNKADVLVNRINMGFGTNWKSHAVAHDMKPSGRADIVMTCLDSAKARHSLGKAAQDFYVGDTLWIDGGNGAKTGQVIMGHLGRRSESRLPNLYDLYGDLLLDSPEESAPSCSHAESIRRQDFGVNHTTAFYMANLVWQMLRHGKVNYQGGFFDLAQGELNPIHPIPDVWAAFGYSGKKDDA
ncbi:PRTRC system ThiF family protein [Salinimonas chungwhensis]|uniref:PRTRC system ThiF family protein n=1 Tax=Salinimonas chungwhensis TaxID=265425 RepID=UPI000380BDD5|nr:PRTRC system ThiF family protein [Salinimonas chungwhensis]